MNMSDPIADMLTRIRNANAAKFDTVCIPSYKMKRAIAEILLNEGYIEKFEIVKSAVNDNFEDIKVYLKYFDGNDFIYTLADFIRLAMFQIVFEQVVNDDILRVVVIDGKGSFP